MKNKNFKKYDKERRIIEKNGNDIDINNVYAGSNHKRKKEKERKLEEKRKKRRKSKE